MAGSDEHEGVQASNLPEVAESGSEEGDSSDGGPPSSEFAAVSADL